MALTISFEMTIASCYGGALCRFAFAVSVLVWWWLLLLWGCFWGCFGFLGGVGSKALVQGVKKKWAGGEAFK